MADEKLMDRARDELFSHINRCGVLQAEAEDQRTWMDETIEYIAERYPDLSDADLAGLHGIGIRFCQPAIAYGSDAKGAIELIRRPSAEEATDAEAGAAEAETVETAEAETVETVETEVEEVGAA
jgi:hypothetical protein